MITTITSTTYIYIYTYDIVIWIILIYAYIDIYTYNMYIYKYIYIYTYIYRYTYAHIYIHIYINIIHDVYLNQQQPHPPWFSGDLSEAKKAAQEAASAASGDVAGWLRHREHRKIGFGKQYSW